jgi:hypothetical protein
MPRSHNQEHRRQLRTPFVHVPTVDWAKVRCGEKQEFRTHANGGNFPWVQPHMRSIDLPFPVVAWTQMHHRGRHEELMMLVDAWAEPLRAISDASIEREGFATRAEFKRYWIHRHPRGGWRGMTNVCVIAIKPLRAAELEEAKERLFNHFFGLWLAPEPYQPLRELA